MKQRIDFVSNSSSSSFMMCGIELEPDKFISTFCTEEDQKKYEDGELDFWQIRDDFEAKSGLNIESAGDGCSDIYGVAIGDSPSNMKDDVTLIEFKKSICEKLKKVGFNVEPSKIEFISGGSDAGGYSFIGSCG